jgi:recombination protein RecR
VFYLLHHPEEQLEDFAERLVALKRDTVLCSICHNVSEKNPCHICEDETRDDTVLCVVEQPLDVMALERSEKFDGRYHVMHGVIAPLNNIGPDQLFLRDILDRLEPVEELILATNPTMEGEATALYIKELIETELPDKFGDEEFQISRIGHGLPVGADIEYADGVTLGRALEGRREL